MRSWLVCSLVLPIALAAPSVARAELGGGKPKIEIKIPSDPDNDSASRISTDYVDAPTDEAQQRYFNLARCTCDDSNEEQLYHALLTWETVPTSSVSGQQLFLYTGSGCDDVPVADRDERCTPLGAITSAEDLTRGVQRFENMSELLNPSAVTAGCDPNTTSTAFNIYTSMDSEATLIEEATLAVTVDMKPPEVPVLVGATAEEGQITLTWDDITSGAEDFEYFQALCATYDGTVAHLQPELTTARYDTTHSVCQTPVGQFDELMLTDGSIVDEANVIDYARLPGDLANLDKKYLCGEASGSAESITLPDLNNNQPYMVVLLAIDKAGNYTARFLPNTVSPQPVTDFWEDVNADNSDLEGGMCLIESVFGGGAGGGGVYGALRAWRDELATTTAGRWLVARYYAWGAPIAAAAQESIIVRVAVAIVLVPLMAIALVWHALGLPLMLALIAALVLWRRRRRAVLAVAALLASPSMAAAQSNTPYWDDSIAVEDDVVTGPRWHFGLRIGPFLPSIDDDRLDTRPYARMFGDGSWMPAFDLHRIWTTRFGQFGGGLSFGYFGKSADAWRPVTPPTIPTERAPGNETSLRIVPIEATAIYRMSQLDDTWGIPLVPYARGGLAYSMWWVRRPDGELSKACAGAVDQCDRGIGASAGLVGAVGLAVRGERIDGDAARSMRDSGLDHAGFYAEISTSWVDGFGSDKKLSLGDTTWSAGVDFEF